MTTRHGGYVVVLKDDIREDDAEDTLNALRMVKGVKSVRPIEGGTMPEIIAKERSDAEWRDKILDLLKKP